MMPRKLITHRDNEPLARCGNPSCNSPMFAEFRWLGSPLLIARCQTCSRQEKLAQFENAPLLDGAVGDEPDSDVEMLGL